MIAAGLLVVMAIIFGIFPHRITAILMPGFINEKFDMTQMLLRYMGPSVIFLGLGTIVYTALNARRQFLYAACPEAGMKLLLVVGLVVFIPIWGIISYPIILLLTTALALVVLLYFLPESRGLFIVKRDESDYRETYRKMIMLMNPLMIGIVFSHISGLVDNWLASNLPSGQLAYLGYAKKLIDALLLMGPVALVTVVFTQLAHFAQDRDRERFASLLSKALRLMVYLSLPLTCLLIGIGQPLIRLLLKRGQFDELSVIGTSYAFGIYVLGFVFLSLEPLIVHSFFALSDTKTPVGVGVLCVMLDIFLAFILVRQYAYLGIAGAFFFSKSIKVAVLISLLNKRLKGVILAGLGYFIIKQMIIAGIILGVSQWLLWLHSAQTVAAGVVWDVLIPSGVAFILFLGLSYLTRTREIGLLLSILRRRKQTVEMLAGKCE
jgi:putative peptidoglycan lipid II flippase